ncbi:MAG: NTE family protein [Paraglaciecola sp.]|jgi:NTE family protein
MHALVISGGGSKGAFAGGVAEYLMEYCGSDYNIFVGTSTGSLLAPMLAAGKMEEIKKIYTSVSNKDIFNINPFIIKKRGKLFFTKINHINTIRMFLKKKKSFGETKNLRKLIAKTFKKEYYTKVRNSKKDVIITVANLTSSRVEYKSIHDCDYEDFCDWMWVSSNIVPFMSLVVKNGMEYADGGFGSYLPVHPAIEKGAKVIDAIVLRPENLQINHLPSTNPFDVLLKAFDFMLNQIGSDDVVIGNLHGLASDVEVNTYFTPHLLTEHSFIFDPEQMTGWWKEGFEFGRDNNPRCVQLG